MRVYQVVIVVPVQHGKPVLVILQQGDGRIVPVGGAAQLAEGVALQGAQHHPQGRSVAEYRHGLAIVLLGNFRQCREKPIQHLPGCIAPGHLPAV